MKYWYQDPYAMFILIVFFFGYLGICYWTASYHAKRRVFDIQLGIGLCLFFSPLIGGIILAFFPQKEPQNLPIKQNTLNKERVSKPRRKINLNIFKKPIKVTLYVIVGLVLCLIITNPGLNRFKEYTPDQRTTHHYALWKRSANFLIFSIYELSSFDRESREDDFQKTRESKYLGIGMNFFELRHK